MKIVIIGCGAMGSVYAGLLARAGNDVVVVDRGVAHVAAINRLGLRVEGASGDHIAAIRAFTQVPDGIADLVILSVKAAQVTDAAPRLGTLIGPETVILTIQNGVGSADILAQYVPADGAVFNTLSGKRGGGRWPLAAGRVQGRGGGRCSEHAMGKADLQRGL